MKNTLRVVLLVFISFGIYFLLVTLYFKALRTLLYEWSNQIGISHIATYAISGIPLFLGTLFINRKTSVFKSLDLDKSAIRGFVFALICTLPMFIGFAFVFNFESDISINTILISVVAAGFFEELFFRGFLFGQLFKNTKLGFIPAVFFGAVYFGLLHLYQSTDLGELTGIFLVTFLGGILFAWVYVEWNYNIWLPIFLHLLMNLTWELFAVSDNALGGVYANVFRLLTIAFIIILTIVYKKQNGLELEVNRRTVWMKGAIG